MNILDNPASIIFHTDKRNNNEQMEETAMILQKRQASCLLDKEAQENG